VGRCCPSGSPVSRSRGCYHSGRLGGSLPLLHRLAVVPRTEAPRDPEASEAGDRYAKHVFLLHGSSADDAVGTASLVRCSIANRLRHHFPRRMPATYSACVRSRTAPLSGTGIRPGGGSIGGCMAGASVGLTTRKASRPSNFRLTSGCAQFLRKCVSRRCLCSICAKRESSQEVFSPSHHQAITTYSAHLHDKTTICTGPSAHDPSPL
jgi:hypothetical protein